MLFVMVVRQPLLTLDFVELFLDLLAKPLVNTIVILLLPDCGIWHLLSEELARWPPGMTALL